MQKAEIIKEIKRERELEAYNATLKVKEGQNQI
jgi:hypothetical protein